MPEKLFIVDLKAVGPQADGGTPKMAELIKEQMLDSTNYFIFHMVDEYYSDTVVNSALEYLGITSDNPNVALIVDRLICDNLKHKINFERIISFDSQLIKVARWEDQNGANKIINLTSDKFLFLMGKPYKRHRIGALYDLYKNGLLKNCDWSFKMSKLYKNIVRDTLSDISDNEFDEFVMSVERELDKQDIRISKDSYHYDGVPIDITLYSNTSFSLVSESMCKSTPWFISEKTWRTIANRHMFIPLFDKDAFMFLNSKGVDTFQKVVKHPIKKFQGTVDDIIVLARENIQDLLGKLSNSEVRGSIIKSIEYNYRVYRWLVKQERMRFPKEVEEAMFTTSAFLTHDECSVFHDLVLKQGIEP